MKGDIIVFNIDDLGRRAAGQIHAFLQADEGVFLHIVKFAPAGRDGLRLWDTAHRTEEIIASSMVIQAVAWKKTSSSIIRIIEPFIL